MILVGVGFLILVVFGAIGAIAARATVQWSWPRRTPVFRIDQFSVDLPSLPENRFPGSQGLRFDRGHARLGAVISDDGEMLTRAVEAMHGEVTAGAWAALDGDLHCGPEEVGEYTDQEIVTPAGIAPAWQFGPSNARTWAVHVHGFQADRQNALRTVDALSPLGVTHLVVSYRGDGTGPAAPGNASRLGLDEWHDVESALAYASAQGAQEILLVGWSMGATISLLLGEHSRFRDRIIGQVFVSPALDWKEIIRAGAIHMGLPLPRAIAALGIGVLATPFVCRIAGLKRPVQFRRVVFTQGHKVRIPTLVIHSTGDRTSPISAARAFAAMNPDDVTLHEVERAAHTREFNLYPVDLGAMTRAWVRSVQDRIN